MQMILLYIKLRSIFFQAKYREYVPVVPCGERFDDLTDQKKYLKYRNKTERII